MSRIFEPYRSTLGLFAAGAALFGWSTAGQPTATVVGWVLLSSLFVLHLGIVAERDRSNRRIACLNRLKDELLGAAGSQEKLDRIAASTVEIFAADFAQVWMTEPGDRCANGCSHAGRPECKEQRRCLHLKASAGRCRQTDEGHGRAPLGIGKIGRIAAGVEGTPSRGKLARDPDGDGAWTAEAGLKTFAGCRLMSPTGEPVGVLAFFSKKRVGAEARGLLENLAEATSRVIATGQSASRLRRAHQRLSFHVDCMPLAYIAWDANFRVTEWNPSAERIFGWTAAEAMGRHADDLIVPADVRGKVAEVWARLEGGERDNRSVNENVDKQGRRRLCEWFNTPLTDDKGGFLGVVSMGHDITDSRRAQERWQLALKGNNDGLWDLDPRSDEVFFSPRWKAILGYEDAELPNCTGVWRDLVHPDDLPWVQQQLRDHLEGRTDYYRSEYRMRARDGSYKWIVAKGQALWDENGQAVRVVGSHADVTDRKRAEEALRESEERFRSLSNASFEGIMIHDQGIILDTNLACARLFGYERPEELIGKCAPDELLARQSKERFLERMKQAGAGLAEVTGLRRDGRTFTAETESRPVRYLGHDGRLVAFRDITERKRAEEALRDSEERYRALFDRSLDCVFLFDFEGRFLDANQATLDLLGYGREEVGKGTLAGIVPHDQLAMARATLEEVKASGRQNSRTEYRLRRKDGGQVFVETQCSLICREGKPFAVQGIARDITERKQAEQALRVAKESAEQASRAKSEFLATVSHEVRTPMNAVIGMTGLLLDTPLTAHQQECAESIRASGETMLAIINDILDFSRIEAGKLVIETSRFDLVQATEDAVALLAAEAEGKGLELVLRFEPGIARAVLGDSGRIRQVLVNLVSNAIKFTPQGSVVVLVTCGAKEGGEARFRVAVSDSGIGIPVAKQQLLFQPFSQVDGSTRRRHNGAGLGLAISKRLMQAMGGEIGLESAPGRGSMFWFSLRLALAEEGSREDFGYARGRRVLVVEASPLVRFALDEQLAHWGIECEHAGTGGEALEVLRRSAVPFDAVLDGLRPAAAAGELARQIGAEFAAGPAVVCLASSKDNAYEVAAGREYSACTFRPVRLSALEEIVTRLWGGGGEADGGLSALQEALAAATGPAGEDAGGHRPRVLVAEDNTLNQKLAKALLDKLGYDADVVANGVEVTHMWHRFPYNAILMDCLMPEMDGYEATGEIRRQECGARRIPIIAMTANAMPGDRQRCLDAGMDDYIAKPVYRETLQRVLGRWVAGQAASVG